MMNPPLSPSSGSSPAERPAPYIRLRKKRARQACETCHARKVKCDVSALGVPCTNCREDEVQCAIRQRARRNTRKASLNASSDESVGQSVSNLAASGVPPFRDPQPRERLQQRHMHTDRASMTSDGLDSIPENGMLSDESHNAYPSTANPVAFPSNMNQFPYDNSFNSNPENPAMTWSQSPGQYNMFDEAFMTELLGQSLNTAYQAPLMNANLQVVQGVAGSVRDPRIDWTTPIDTGAQASTSQPVVNMTDPVLHAVKLPGSSQQTFAWASVDIPKGLQGRSEDEIEFIQKQGCLSIPAKSLLQVFVRAYFLYAHPAIPMFLESEFDMLWLDDTPEDCIPPYGSIFVLQAILFVACSFVPDDTISNCGFQSVRNARGSFYRRAKLLCDFEGEQDPFNIARGALLLAYQAPNDNGNLVRRVNCHWLSLAIRSARIVDADLYYSKTDVTPTHKLLLKRLWWSCIFRDRILPLGLRRPVQITADSFDWSRGEPLSENDFLPEIEHSRIYDANTQRSLAKLLVAMCGLAKHLTYAISAAFPIDRNVQQIYDGEDYFNQSRKSIQKAHKSLLDWYEDTISIFPVPIGLGDAPSSVVLFANLMYIYYQAGVIALSHREALLLVYRASKESPSRMKGLHGVHAEVVPAFGDMTERLREVVHLKMAQYLPISAVAYLTLPWVMHILDSKFAYTKSSQAVKHRRLHIFEDIMRHQSRNFDGVEYVNGMVQRLSDYIDHACEVLKLQAKPAVQSWDELLITQPRFYLRLCVFIDLAFSRGEFPIRIDQEI